MFGWGNLNFNELKDSLRLNSFQTSTGYGSAQDETWLTNPAGLKVINQRKFFGSSEDGMASAQQMIYLGITEYDQYHVDNAFETKHNDADNFLGDLRLIAPGTAGFMVRDADPDGEYRYGRTAYRATFRGMFQS